MIMMISRYLPLVHTSYANNVTSFLCKPIFPIISISLSPTSLSHFTLK